MWYYNSQIIKAPKAMVIATITYPQAIFKNSTQLASLGIKSYRQNLLDHRYYTHGSYSVDTSGDEVIGTYASVDKDLTVLRTKMLNNANTAAANKHVEIDWYWTRAAKGGTGVPSNIATYATALYSEHETIKTAIAACNTMAKIIAYENKPYTETRKVQNADGSYHATDTYTVARGINMCTHFSNNPTVAVSEDFVSLVAD
mgnify:CR=1 FL=1